MKAHELLREICEAMMQDQFAVVDVVGSLAPGVCNRWLEHHKLSREHGDVLRHVLYSCVGSGKALFFVRASLAELEDPEKCATFDQVYETGREILELAVPLH